MNLAPLTTRRRQDVWSPHRSPSSSPLTSSSAAVAAAFCDDDGFLPHSAYSASIPAPLDLSYCDPSADDFFVDSRQSTPYDHSTFDPADIQLMTDGSAHHPRVFIQPSTSRGLPETYTPPPMNAGSYQSQAWNTNNSNNNHSSSSGVPNWPQLAANSSQHHRKIAFRTHKRLSSGSSTGSVGPDSPYTQTSDYPQIVDADTASAHSPHHLDTYETLFTTAEQFAKPLAAQSNPLNDGSLFSPVYSVTPPTDHAAQFIAAQAAMSQGQRGRGQRRRNLHAGDAFTDVQGDYAMSSEVGSPGGSTIPGLARNISEVYQDELYNPNLAGPTQSPSASSSSQAGHLNASSQAPGQSPRQSQGQGPGPGPAANSHLSPTYRTTFTDRRQAADAARSTSPAGSLVRERSPFRADSEYAGASDLSQGPNSPARINSAAPIRAPQNFDADAAQAFAQHHSQIAAQDFAVTPSTVSPKDTYRDFHDSEDESKNFALFPPQNLQETFFPPTTVPTARRPTASAAALGAAYGARSDVVDFSTPTSNPADFSFMASSMSGLPPQYPFISQSRRPSSGMRNHQHPADTMPEFPATLSSMESTKSEASPGDMVRPSGFEPQSQPSSQDETSGSTSPPQRPTDTSANSGTWTCTAPSCSARFDSSLKLHKHRRDCHRASSPGTSAAASTPNPTTPSSVASVATNAGGGASSSTAQQNAQAAANNVSRNNLPGPHKCERINPSTGKPCNTNFSRSYDLTRHEETIHSNRKQKVRCQLCTEAKTFSRNDALTRHMRVVHPDVEFSGKSGRRGRH